VYVQALQLLSPMARNLAGEDNVPKHIGDDLLKRTQDKRAWPPGARRTAK
jgi:hypothetical protein